MPRLATASIATRMTIRFSDLPTELRRRVLQEADLKPAAARPPQAKRPERPGKLMRVCSCRCEIFRPDGVYPETCDGCGRKVGDGKARASDQG